MSERPDRVRWSAARRLVVGAAAAFAGIVAVQPLAQLVRAALPWETPATPMAWCVGAVAIAVAVALALPGRRALTAGAASGLTAAVVLELAVPGAWAPAVVLAPLGMGLAVAAERLGRRLPERVDSLPRRRPVLAALWVLLALASLAQTARLASFAADPERDFVLGSTEPFWNGHLCLPAYLHGAEMALDGEPNLYDASHWPALDPEAAPASAIEGLPIEDPYQYPPQFLLLPALGLVLTSDWTLLLVVWFGLQTALFVAAYVALARRVGGRAGETALWLLPALFLAFPVLYALQFGQVHLAAVAAAVLALLAFERGRAARGGALLAAAVLAKVFPVVLVAYLAGRRRWRDLAWTAGWAAALTVLALAAFGPAPFVAFLDYQLPRLGDGAAFAFDEAWPEISGLVVADNQGVFGLVRKLGGSKPAAAAVGRAFGLLLVAGAVWLGLRRRRSEPLASPTTALALLGLASLASPGAWGDYVPSVAVWLLPLVAARVAGRPWLAAGVGATALFQWSLLGTFPWGPLEVMVPLSAVGVVTMLALYGSTLVADARLRVATQDLPAGAEPDRLAA